MSLIKRVSDLLSVSGEFHVALADLDLQVSARLDADRTLPAGDGQIRLLGCSYRGRFQLLGSGREGKPPTGP